jgi:hypothetical protein
MGWLERMMTLYVYCIFGHGLLRLYGAATASETTRMYDDFADDDFVHDAFIEGGTSSSEHSVPYTDISYLDLYGTTQAVVGRRAYTQRNGPQIQRNVPQIQCVSPVVTDCEDLEKIVHVQCRADWKRRTKPWRCQIKTPSDMSLMSDYNVECDYDPSVTDTRRLAKQSEGVKYVWHDSCRLVARGFSKNITFLYVGALVGTLAFALFIYTLMPRLHPPPPPPRNLTSMPTPSATDVVANRERLSNVTNDERLDDIDAEPLLTPSASHRKSESRTTKTRTSRYVSPPTATPTTTSELSAAPCHESMDHPEDILSAYVAPLLDSQSHGDVPDSCCDSLGDCCDNSCDHGCEGCDGDCDCSGCCEAVDGGGGMVFT